MKYLITGVAGTGKSSVATELKRRGYAAYDVDAGFSYYADRQTGDKVFRPLEPTLEWYDNHERVFDEQILKNLFKKHANELLFVCSITANQKKFYPDFEKLFLLQAPNSVIEKRLKMRTNNHFGKHPIEKHRVISGHQAFDDELLAAGAVAIDSTRPINQVVNEILELLK